MKWPRGIHPVKAQKLLTTLNELKRTFRKSRNLNILLASIIVVNLGFGILAPIMPKFATNNLNMDEATLGFAYSLYSLAYIIGLLPAGLVSDRIGCKFCISSGVLIFGVTTYLMIHAQNSLEFGILRTLEGFGASLVSPTVFALTVNLAPKENKAVVLGALGTAESIGALGGPGIGGLLAANLGIYSPFYVTAAISVCCAVLVLTIDDSHAEHVARSKPARFSMKKWREGIRCNRIVVALTFRGFIMGIVTALWDLGLILFWYSRIHMNETEVGVLLTIGAIVSAIAIIPFGTCSDRYGRRGLILAGGLAMSVGVGLNIIAFDFWSVCIFVIIAELGTAMSNPSIGATFADLIENGKMGSMMGTYLMVKGIGTVFGFSALGLLFVGVGPEIPLLTCCIAIAAATLIVFLFVPETHTRSISPERTL